MSARSVSSPTGASVTAVRVEDERDDSQNDESDNEPFGDIPSNPATTASFTDRIASSMNPPY